MNEKKQKTVKLEETIRQLENSQKILAGENEKYRTLIENAGEAITVVQDGVIKFANPKGEELYGYSQEELVSRPHTDFIHETDRKMVGERLENRLKGEKLPASYSFRIVNKTGDTRWADITVSPYSWDGRSAVLCLIKDVTEWKIMEKKMKEQHNLLRTLVDNMPDYIYIKDAKCRFILNNKSHLQLMGVKSQKETLDKTDFDFFSPDLAEQFHSNDQKVIRMGNNLINIEECTKDTEGNEQWVLTSKAPMKDDNGEIIGLVGISRDITEWKLVEKKLEERIKELHCLYGISKISERKGIALDETYQEIVNLLPSAWQYPEITCSRIVFDKKNYKTDNFRKTRWMQQADIIVNTKIAGSIEIYYFEEKPDQFEGPFLKEERNLINAIAKQLGEYTEHKQVEDELVFKSNLLSSLLDHIPDSIYFKDKEGRYVEVSQGKADELGITREEIIGKMDYTFSPKKEWDKVKERYEEEFRIMREEVPVINMEEHIMKLSGEEWWASTTKVPRYDKNGNVLGILGIARNITERKQVETALKNSEERFKISFDFAPDAIYINDLKGTFIDGNKAAEKMLGYNKEELIGKSFIKLNILGKTQIPRALKLLARNILGKPTGPDEFILKRKDGREVKAEILTYPVKIKGKIQVLGIARDITERQRAEEALKESEKRYRQLVENANDIIYKTDENGKFTFVNDTALRILGYSEEEVIGKPYLDLVCPEYQKRVERFYGLQFVKKTLTTYYEFPVLTKLGEKLWLGQNVQLMIETDREVGFQSIARDVTERKKLEYTLEERMKELQCFFTISDITERPGITLHTIYQEVVNSLPLSWQYPEITCSRIIINNKEFGTNNYRETKWKQSAVIEVNKVKAGFIEVCYLEERQKSDEGPFLKEERMLINAIAERLGKITERTQAEKKLLESEEKYRTFVDTASDLMAITDKDAKFTDVNTLMVNTLGYSKEELTEMLISQILTKESIKKDFKSNWKKFIKEGKINIETIFATKNGEEIIVELKAVAIYDNNGNYEGTRMVCHDITQQKKLQNEIAESEELLNSITTSAQEGIIVIDNDGDVIFWNDSAETIFGYSAEEITGKNFHETIAPVKYHDSHRKGFKAFKKTGKGVAIGQTLELFALSKNGKEFPVELSLSAIKINNNWHGIGIIRDITKRKEVEGQLEEAKTHAEQANRAKSEFLANMSHEIRTPMNAILGFAEILEDKLTTTPEYHDYVTGIRNSGKGLLGLINDILDLSKIEAGKLEINYESINPYAIIDEIRQIYSLKTKEKKLNFEINVDPDLPKGLLFDETRLRQILFNLIGNAIKFTNEGGVMVNVKSKDGYEEGSFIDLFIEVIDTGIGIIEKSQRVIFEPFRQKDGQSTRRYGGTGLGLTITKRLVNLMNGTISLESEEGKGSTFEIFLPHIQVSALVESTASEAEDVSGIEFKNPQILLVEDVESNRKVVRGYLESCNIRIIEAENGSIGIEKAEKFKPDLILMDMQMPGIDGYEATGIIKAKKELKNIPIIALTASSLKSDISKIKNICDGFLRKPVTKSQLISELKKFLPFTKQEEPEEKGAKQEMDYIHELKQLALQKNRIPKELVDIFRIRIIPDFENIMKNRSNKKIRNFASMILETGKEYNLEVLENYGNELQEYINSFNVKNINAMLTDFSEMAEIFRT